MGFFVAVCVVLVADILALSTPLLKGCECGLGRVGLWSCFGYLFDCVAFVWLVFYRSRQFARPAWRRCGPRCPLRSRLCRLRLGHNKRCLRRCLYGGLSPPTRAARHYCGAPPRSPCLRRRRPSRRLAASGAGGARLVATASIFCRGLRPPAAFCPAGMCACASPVGRPACDALGARAICALSFHSVSPTFCTPQPLRYPGRVPLFFPSSSCPLAHLTPLAYCYCFVINIIFLVLHLDIINIIHTFALVKPISNIPSATY